MLATMPFAVTCGIVLDAASAEEVRGHLPWAPERCTTAGMMHGGAVMTLADTVGRGVRVPQPAAGRVDVDGLVVDQLLPRGARRRAARHDPAAAHRPHDHRRADRAAQHRRQARRPRHPDPSRAHHLKGFHDRPRFPMPRSRTGSSARTKASRRCSAISTTPRGPRRRAARVGKFETSRAMSSGWPTTPRPACPEAARPTSRPRRCATHEPAELADQLRDVVASLRALVDVLDDAAWSGPSGVPDVTLAQACTVSGGTPTRTRRHPRRARLRRRSRARPRRERRIPRVPTHQPRMGPGHARARRPPADRHRRGRTEDHRRPVPVRARRVGPRRRRDAGPRPERQRLRDLATRRAA